MAMKIDRNICTSCGECATVCPTNSITPGKGAYQIDAATCTECEGEGQPGVPQCYEACFEEDCIVQV